MHPDLGAQTAGRFAALVVGTERRMRRFGPDGGQRVRDLLQRTRALSPVARRIQSDHRRGVGVENGPPGQATRALVTAQDQRSSGIASAVSYFRYFVRFPKPVGPRRWATISS